MLFNGQLSIKNNSKISDIACTMTDSPLTRRKEVFFASWPTPLLATHSKAPESAPLTFLTSRYTLSETLVVTVLQ